ncbi:MAG TPA: O-methyltransferase, partial [Gaiellaceae bacterium]
PDEILAYVDRYSTPSSKQLDELAQETARTLGSPNMLSGPVVGRLLEFLVFALEARSVLEIGTFSGYSALAMAEGLPPDGRIVTLEIDESHAELARRAIAESPHADKIEIVLGPALESLERLPGPFDFVFIDADKVGYPAYNEVVLPKLAPRGLIAVDNTLRGGSVLDEADRSPAVEATRAFNERVRNDPRVRCVILSVSDGVTLIRHA